MDDCELKRHFDRFRASGDADALGAVFDRTAPGLYRVARHLAPDEATAEDLVQTTFLTALERAAAYDASRPLRPWLAGILVRHAAHRRRRERPRPGPPATTSDDVDPLSRIEAAEVAEEVARALRELPQKYREVVEPRLDGRGGREIAAALGRSPGVVRMQIHRGLELLRRALPRSLALSALFWLGSRRALARVRSNVLASAGVGPAAPTLGFIGGIVMAKKWILGGAAALALAAGAALLHDDDPGSVRANDVAAAPVEPALRAERPPAEVERRPLAATEPLAPFAGATPEDASGFPASFARSLAGVRGRLVEADGAPVAAKRVALLEATPAELLVDVADVARASRVSPRVAAGETTTGADGRFEIGGAHPRGLHALGIDLGGPRATMRVVDLGLRSGAVTDLGDVVLPPGVRLTGRVVGEDGAPIASARVRATEIPRALVAFGAEHVRRGSRIVALDRRGGRHAVIEPPAWVHDRLEALPIPTATTGADGRFEIEKAPVGLVTVLVDHPERPARALGPFPTGRGPARDVGDLVLAAGRTLAGRLVDAEDAPVAGAELAAGVAPAAGNLVFTSASATSDDGGRFALGPLPCDVDAVVAVRPRASPTYVVFESVDAVDAVDDGVDVRLELPLLGALVVTLETEEGAPIEEAEVLVSARTRLDEIDPWIPAPADHARLAGVDAGVYRADAIPPGEHRLAVRAAGFGVTRRNVRLEGPTTRVSMTLARGAPLDVRVVDAGNGTPVEHARVTVGADDETPAVAAGRTGADGSVRLAPFARSSGAAWLRVDHPGYAVRTDRLAPGATEVEVALTGGGAVDGRVRVDGDAPREPLMVRLRRILAEHALDGIPLLTMTDGAGRFSFHGLARGVYVYEVSPRITAGDPLDVLLAFDDHDARLAAGSVRIDADGPTELEVDVSSSAERGLLHGTVTVDGHGAADAEVAARSREGPVRSRSTRTDSAGRYRLEALDAGPVRVSVTLAADSGGGATGGPAQWRDVVIEAARPTRLDFLLHPIPIRVHVTAAGREIEGARLSVNPADDVTPPTWRTATTGAGGLGVVTVHAPGAYRVEAFENVTGRTVVRVDVGEEGTVAPIEIELAGGTPCAGRFTLDDALADVIPAPAHIQIFEQYDGRYQWRKVPVDLTGRTFEIRGLEPGSFIARLVSGDDQSRAVEFDLGAEGNRSLLLAFEAE